MNKWKIVHVWRKFLNENDYQIYKRSLIKLGMKMIIGWNVNEGKNLFVV